VRLTNDQATRAFLGAQGFRDGRPAASVDARHLRRVIDRVGLLQIDSVNVVTRAHYVPLFARLGPYDRTRLDAYIYERREMFEYWCHEQSYAPVAAYPAMRARMRKMERHPWRRIRELLADQRGYVESVLEEVGERGPISAGELSDPGKSTGPWWGYGKGKLALDWLFSTGRVTVANRVNFQRFYDLPERSLPAEVLEAPELDEGEAIRERLRRSIRSLGVATLRDLADYFRMKPRDIGPHVEAMAAAGELVPAEVRGWHAAAYARPDLTVPRAVPARALVAPFDSLVWDRARTERMFDFRYRIEIYVPEPKRVYGYYVFPFLLDGRLSARVDLKADRAAGVLRVHGAFGESDVDRVHVAKELRDELELMAAWLGLGGLELGDRGDLMAALRSVA
jgi:uncharacterized protein YcaQ